jgi:hypothetical protein
MELVLMSQVVKWEAIGVHLQCSPATVSSLLMAVRFVKLIQNVRQWPLSDVIGMIICVNEGTMLLKERAGC